MSEGKPVAAKQQQSPKRMISLSIALSAFLLGPVLMVHSVTASAVSTRHADDGTDFQMPKIFEPGNISGPANDDAPTFLPDGRTLLFDRSGGSWSVILTSELIGPRWSKPAVASFSGPSSDQQPAIAPDGKYAIFSSTRRVTTISKTQASTFATNLYRVDRVGGGWGTPVRLASEVNISSMIFKPSIASNHDVYFMSRSKAPDTTQWRLYRASSIGSSFEQAQPLSFSDGRFSDVDPFIAPDQSYLIFSSKGRRTPIDDDHEHLYVVFRHGSEWGRVIPMRYQGDDRGYDDGDAQVSPDGRTLYFTSGRSDPIDRNRTRSKMFEDLRRMETWDNGNSNVWTLSLQPLLKTARNAETAAS